MFSYFEPNFIEKFLWESGFSKFGQNRNDARNKNRLFGRRFETVQHFKNFLQNCDFLCPVGPTYMVQISLQNSGGTRGFLRGGSMEPPLGHQWE